jgi:prophage antirepressor-like protein
MDILKAFSLLDTNHEINIQGTLEDPLFQANQIGKLLEIKNIRENLRDLDEKYKTVILIDTLGGKQETVFLTEFGLYKILGRSRKPIASFFQDWVVNVLKEIRINGMYKLQQEREIDRKLLENKCKKSHHNTLLKAFHKKKLIYICKLNDVDETHYIIKIGSSQDIKSRINNIATQYGIAEPLLLDIIETNNMIPFENFIHKHSFISQYHEAQTIQNGISTRETYLVDNAQYNEFIKIIQENKSKFEDNENSIEMEQERQKTEQLRNDVEDKIIIQKELDIQIQNLLLEKEKVILKQKENDNAIEERPVGYTLSNFQVKKRNNGERIPQIYKYDPDNLQTPIKIYDSPADAEREEGNISVSALKLATINNTIYKDHRWFIVHRNEPTPQTIPETVASKSRSTDIHYIAMMDIKKTKIVQVFATQKDAAEARNMKTNGFSRAIKEDTQSSGHYWNYFDKCSEEMQSEYLLNNTLPEKFTPTVGKKIQQIDPKTNTVLKTYPSKRDIIKLFQMSNTTLSRLIDTDEIYKGYRWSSG